MKNSRFQSFLGPLALLAWLAACSGMTPGGGAPTEVAQGGGGGPSINNSLDSVGNGGATVGGGDLPGAGSGQAAPSTQQTTEGIGAPCVISFKVSVKTLRNGAEEACVAAVARLSVDHSPTTGENAPPEPPALGPTVTRKFNFEAESGPFDTIETQPAQCIDGRWRAEGFLVGYPQRDRQCSTFHSVSFQATWIKDGKNFLSNTFQGPPLPETPDEDPIVPIELTIELGGSKLNDQINPDELPVLSL